MSGDWFVFFFDQCNLSFPLSFLFYNSRDELPPSLISKISRTIFPYVCQRPLNKLSKKKKKKNLVVLDGLSKKASPSSLVRGVVGWVAVVKSRYWNRFSCCQCSRKSFGRRRCSYFLQCAVFCYPQSPLLCMVLRWFFFRSLLDPVSCYCLWLLVKSNVSIGGVTETFDFTNCI